MSEYDLSRLFVFRSSGEYYWKEEHDIKNNTVRKIDLNDVRFRELIAWMETGWNDGDIKIKMLSAESLKFFVRDIRDISVRDDLMVITWIPMNEGVKK